MPASPASTVGPIASVFAVFLGEMIFGLGAVASALAVALGVPPEAPLPKPALTPRTLYAHVLPAPHAWVKPVLSPLPTSDQGPKPPPLVSTWYWYPTIDDPPSSTGVCHETSTPPGLAMLAAAVTAVGALGPAPSFSAMVTVPVALAMVAPTALLIV